jgi:phosphoribosyl 1,2-cyclic phosphodiesterase
MLEEAELGLPWPDRNLPTYQAALQFTVLASGSAGNASLLEADGFGLLLDAGLGPRLLASRLRAIGASWRRVQAVLLTHTHTDHWNDRTFAHLAKLGIPLYCHEEHQRALRTDSPAFAALESAGLVRGYEVDGPLPLAAGLASRPFRLCHDGGLTCGFRFEGTTDGLGPDWALGYATDLGSWQPELARRLASVDVLALEFNHDVALERSSGRSPRLIARVLGDHGHLSNLQAAALVRQILNLSEPGRLRHLVQMHLSRDCNRPGLAVEALGALPAGLQVHTARQDQAGPHLRLGAPARSLPPRGRARRVRQEPCSNPAYFQALLPGWEEGAPGLPQ